MLEIKIIVICSIKHYPCPVHWSVTNVTFHAWLHSFSPCLTPSPRKQHGLCPYPTQVGRTSTHPALFETLSLSSNSSERVNIHPGEVKKATFSHGRYHKEANEQSGKSHNNMVGSSHHHHHEQQQQHHSHHGPRHEHPVAASKTSYKSRGCPVVRTCVYGRRWKKKLFLLQLRQHHHNNTDDGDVLLQEGVRLGLLVTIDEYNRMKWSGQNAKQSKL